MTETVENLETIENRSEAINEVSVTETTASAETPATTETNSENAAVAETSNAEEAQPAQPAQPAPATENAATAETSTTPETTEPKLCGTDPKIICDVVHGLFSEPKTAEVKPEEPTRSLEFQTTKVVSSNVVPKVPVQYVENPLKFAKGLKKPTGMSALDKIKDVAANLKLMGKEAEGEFIVKAFDNITNPTLERKEFEIKDTEELAKAFFGRDVIAPKNPGSLNSNTFTITENAETNPTGKSFQDNNAGTVTDKVIDSAYGTIAAQVNFDMISELRERVYHAKFELDKVVGVKGELFDSLEQSLKKAEEILDVERSNIVMHNLQEITKVLEAVKVEELAPEDRKALWDAIHNLKCANNLVNKAGFKDRAGDNEKIVQEHVAKALKLYPKLKEDVRMQALSSQIFALSE
jgi:hypothetical protein|nr:MAG TPA: hypothetical protein [Caudoviricetes sp.]